MIVEDAERLATGGLPTFWYYPARVLCRAQELDIRRETEGQIELPTMHTDHNRSQNCLSKYRQ